MIEAKEMDVVLGKATEELNGLGTGSISDVLLN